MQRRERLAHEFGRRLGFDVVRRDFNSPITDVGSLRPSMWEIGDEMPGVDLRIDEALTFLTDVLGPYLAEFQPPDDPPGVGHGYYRHNGMYPSVDGEILYAMIRHCRPARVLEVGAGFSSLVISDALARNADEGASVCVRDVYDPFVPDRARGASVEIKPVRAQDVPVEAFAALRESDVLMIDTTHTVKPGGDVTRLVLEVLPSLAAGVVVHIHDFFRPYPYPRWFLTELGVHWQEQYLVQALLADSDAFEVVLANYALVRAHKREVASLIRGADSYPDAPGSALWIRRTGS